MTWPEAITALGSLGIAAYVLVTITKIMMRD